MTDKIFCGSGSQKTVDLKDGGKWTFLRLSFSRKDLATLEAHADDESGWVNATVHKRREPSEKGVTHYLCVDTYKRPEDDLPDSDLEKMKPAGAGDEDNKLPF